MNIADAQVRVYDELQSARRLVEVQLVLVGPVADEAVVLVGRRHSTDERTDREEQSEHQLELFVLRDSRLFAAIPLGVIKTVSVAIEDVQIEDGHRCN